MNPARPLLLLLLLAAICPALAEQPGPVLRERLAALARPPALVADFTEARHTPLKKKPLVLDGVARLDRARGLSLEYSGADAALVILDERGLLIRRPGGREQSPPHDAARDLRLLHALFSLDLPALRESYEVASSTGEDGSWTLLFTRRPDAEAAYRELLLEGDATRLARVVLTKTPNLRTEIVLGPPRLPLSFTPEEIARYFR